MYSMPPYAYAANRNIGFEGLKLLLKYKWIPAVLILPNKFEEKYINNIKELIPQVSILWGKDFRSQSGINLLKTLDLDYILSVHFPYIIPHEVLKIPRFGTLNLHPAFLPYNRGWHTPTWAIIDDTPYGATLHWVDEGIDTGNIALQRELEILPGDTAHSLYQKVLKLELELLEDSIPIILQNNLPRVLQEKGGTMHSKSDLQSIRRIQFTDNNDLEKMIRLIRALTTNNWDEAAFFELNGIRYSVRIDIKMDQPE